MAVFCFLCYGNTIIVVGQMCVKDWMTMLVVIVIKYEYIRSGPSRIQ